MYVVVQEIKAFDPFFLLLAVGHLNAALKRNFFKSTVMRKTAKEFNISGWLFSSLIAKSKVPIHTYYLPH